MGGAIHLATYYTTPAAFTRAVAEARFGWPVGRDLLARVRGQFTTSLPVMPASRWPATEQQNSYSRASVGVN